LRLLRVTAFCLRFFENLKVSKNKRLLEDLSVDELNKGLLVLCNIVQNNDFADEINALKANKLIPRNSTIACLNPFLDDNGVLRVSGRISKAFFSNEQKVL